MHRKIWSEIRLTDLFCFTLYARSAVSKQLGKNELIHCRLRESRWLAEVSQFQKGLASQPGTNPSTLGAQPAFVMAAKGSAAITVLNSSFQLEPGSNYSHQCLKHHHLGKRLAHAVLEAGTRIESSVQSLGRPT